MSFRKWLGVNPYFASGSYEWDIEIWIDWSLVSASSFYLAWTGRFGGGGTLTVTNTHLETPTFIYRYYNSCCTDILFETNDLNDATSYKWTRTEFGSPPVYNHTTTSNTWETNVTYPGGSGSIEVWGYFPNGCSKYGGSKKVTY